MLTGTIWTKAMKEKKKDEIAKENIRLRCRPDQTLRRYIFDRHF